MRKPVRVFLLLILLTVVVVFIDLPSEYSPAILKRFTTHLGLDLSGGTHIVLEADMKGIQAADRENALNSAKEVIDRRVNFFGVSEPVVQTALTKNSYRIIVELPGVTDVEQAVG